MRILIMAALFVLMPVMAAHADTEDTILELPQGQVILSISATERREVEQDLLVATLSYMAEDRNSRELQDEINTVMAKAVETAKKVKAVKVNTDSYQVYERTDARTKERIWHGNQSMTLKSKDPEAVLKLAGELQSMKLTMNDLSYTLAPETAIEVQDSLMEDALDQLQTRANRAAKALGKTTAELKEVTVQGQNIPYAKTSFRNTMAMDVAESAMAAPVAEAGESTLTLTVSARALLKP